MSQRFSDEAQRLITGRCLIASDVDKTLILQSDGERERFVASVGLHLALAAQLGTNLAFLTGNSMNELCSRLLTWLIEMLCPNEGHDRLDLLSNFHVFTNGGAVYAHFPEEELSQLQKTIARGEPRDRHRLILDTLTEVSATNGDMVIKPQYLVGDYIEGTRIEHADEQRILPILEEELERYKLEVRDRSEVLSQTYDLAKVRRGAEELSHIEKRQVLYRYGQLKQVTVQITVKPVLSFWHARRRSAGAPMIEDDLRVQFARRIQQRLDSSGLEHYVARPGGSSSIDIAPEKIDKAYALEKLIDRLNLQGTARRQQRLGSNAIYLGDEVVAGSGNDYPVTRIPGLLVFAVNSDRRLVPFLSRVLVPSLMVEGPDAVAEILRTYNRIARRLLDAFDTGTVEPRAVETALDLMKEQLLVGRIQEKVDELDRSMKVCPEDLQRLHAFVTLICRKDEPAREWLAMLVDHFDAIMAHLATEPRQRGPAPPPAMGTSHH